MIVQALFTLGVVLLLATANVYYRDVAMVMEVVLLAWFFLSPVFYDYGRFQQVIELGPISIGAERLAYIVNPIATLIANYRTVLYGGTVDVPGVGLVATPPGPPDLGFLLRTLATGLVVLAVGLWFFNRHAGRFGEEV
jgi:ABC-type polysaccharide/polyol phosphate export permease